MKTLSEVKKILRNHKDEFKKTWGIKELGIFGSYIRGEDKDDSDLDILVEFESDITIGLLKFISLENYLQNLLNTKVDLVMKSALKPRIGKQILKEAIYL